MEKIYSIQEIADLLGSSIASIYSYERRGYIKRIPDGNQKFRSGKFSKEQVDWLVTLKTQLDSSGNSLSDLARNIGVSPGKVKEAVVTLGMDVEKVQISLFSTRKRYALKPEQEYEIIKYLEEQTEGRPRRNYLYYTHMNIAHHQLFLIDGNLPVRLLQNSKGRLGFQLNKNHFLSYKKALRVHRVEPAYPIHRPQQEGKNKNSFTDLIIPIGDNNFYMIIDILYSVCGEKNFNAQYRNENLFVSVRNGNYQIDRKKVVDASETFGGYIVFGEVKEYENVLSFSLPQKVLEIQLDQITYHTLNRRAEENQIPLFILVQHVLREQAIELQKQQK